MERLETLGVVEFGVPVRDGDDPSDDLVDFLAGEGVVGAVNSLTRDSASQVFGVLFADESDVPARWFPDVGSVGFGRGDLDGFRTRLRDRFGRSAWVGAPVAADGGESETGASDSWGIRSFAWYTESHQFGAPELVARAIGAPVIWVPLGRGLLFVPREPQGLVMSEYWRRGRSILMWATGARRAFAAGGALRADLHWWDEHFIVIDPSNGWEVDDDGFTVRQIVERIFEPDPAFPVMIRAARVSEDGRQEFRIELRKRSSTTETFERIARLCGVPPEVALVAEGRLDPLELPGAGIAAPASVAESIWVDTRIPLRGPLQLTQWWSRVTANRPWWYRAATVAVAVWAVIITTLVIVQGRPADDALLPLAAAAVWIIDYARPRSRAAGGGQVEDGASRDPVDGRADPQPPKSSI